MKPRVLITERLDDGCAAWLAERAELVWVSHSDPRKMAEALPEAQGMVVRTYTRVDAALLTAAPKLRVVGRAGVGLDNVDLDACREAGVRVVYTPDANTQAVVEYVTGLMLKHVRPFTTLPGPPEVADAETFHAMRKTEVGVQLDERTLGILGFGRIGKRLGAVAHAIGMNLLVCDLLPEAELRKAVDYPFDFVSHAELYAGSDIVSVHVDGRAENRGLIDAAAFAAMRPTAHFINAARGMLVDHEALLAWAEANPDAHATLDVHDPEPPPEDSPLHRAERVVLLPHLASRTDTALKNMSWVVRDVAAVLAGEEPRFPAA
ncbi:MAG: NAD(P)-dependent oxidoreductase [Planctomycetota bacterium]